MIVTSNLGTRLREMPEATHECPMYHEAQPARGHRRNTFARRHHIRAWKSPQTYEGRELWLGAGTHDIGIAVLKGGHAWYYLVDPQIDREQAKVRDDLLFTGRVGWFSWFDRPGVPRRSVNGTGDELRTEGRLLVLWLADVSPRS